MYQLNQILFKQKCVTLFCLFLLTCLLSACTTSEQDNNSSDKTPKLQTAINDLGNYFDVASDCNMQTHHALRKIQAWSATIPCNHKVRLLIEKGYADSEAVSKLLKNKIAAEIKNYQQRLQAREKQLSAYRKDLKSHATIAQDDAHYAKHGQYQDAIFELWRTHYVIHSSLYILANIKQLDAKTLASWIDEPKNHGVESHAMQYWLAEVFAKKSQKNLTLPNWDDTSTVTLLDIPSAIKFSPEQYEELLKHLNSYRAK